MVLQVVLLGHLQNSRKERLLPVSLHGLSGLGSEDETVNPDHAVSGFHPTFAMLIARLELQLPAQVGEGRSDFIDLFKIQTRPMRSIP